MACCSLASFAALSRSLGRVMVVVGNVRKIAWPRSTGGPDRPALTYCKQRHEETLFWHRQKSRAVRSC